MKEDILLAMTRESAFCRAEIEWCHFFAETDRKPYWNIYLVSAHTPGIRYPLETARGKIRDIKTLDAAYSLVQKVTEGRLTDIRIIKEPW